MKCSICKNDLEEIKDFGKHPLSNNLLSSETETTKKYPLVLGYCKECELLQLTKKIKSEILFDRNYPYKSGVSERFIEHCKTFAESLKTNLPLDILEIGGNDGTLAKETTRKNKLTYHYIIDPCFPDVWDNENYPNVIGIKKLFDKRIFGTKKFDVIILQNSFAHLPNPSQAINDCYSLLKDKGKIIIELPTVEYTIANFFWETVYFEHQFYWSVGSLKKFMESKKLYLSAILHLPETQGGSARFTFSKQKQSLRKFINPMDIYKGIKKSILEFEKRRENLKEFVKQVESSEIIGITAPAKTSVLIDLLGKEELNKINFIVDDTPGKQGKFLACNEKNFEIKPFSEIPKDSVCIILSKNYEKVLSEKVKSYKPSVIFSP